MRRRISQEQGMSLFPFLAVLICTMGTLIVLLVLFVEQARVFASAPGAKSSHASSGVPTEPAILPHLETPSPVAAQDLAAERAERERQRAEQQRLELERDEHLWRKGILEAQREEKTRALTEGRLKLGHLEDHIRQLSVRWKELQGEATQIVDPEATATTEAEAQLAEIEQRKAQLQQQIQQRQQTMQSRPKAYAILPYEGPNGTRRRPIYLECTAAGIILQPAGITMSAEDLQGPQGAGNPLDAALRAIREYWRETGVLVDNDPYPLLLVRPAGVDSYAIARASLSSWDDEFGYELVGKDKPLAFPEPDPTLIDRVQKAIELAKERQSLLASAMPKAYGQQRQIGAMRASRNGGFVPVNGGDDELKEQADRMLAGRANPGSPASPKSATPPSLTGPQGAPQGSPEATGAPGANTPNGTGKGAAPISDSRGANWALHNHNASATGWSRPVQVLCMQDRLVVLQEKNGVEPSRTIMVDGPLHGKMDQFAEVVRKHVEGWGTPPPNGYWKPMLFMEVGVGGENVYRELQLLLENSGFEMRRARP